MLTYKIRYFINHGKTTPARVTRRIYARVCADYFRAGGRVLVGRGCGCDTRARCAHVRAGVEARAHDTFRTGYIRAREGLRVSWLPLAVLALCLDGWCHCASDPGRLALTGANPLCSGGAVLGAVALHSRCRAAGDVLRRVSFCPFSGFVLGLLALPSSPLSSVKYYPI